MIDQLPLWLHYKIHKRNPGLNLKHKVQNLVKKLNQELDNEWHQQQQQHSSIHPSIEECNTVS